MTFSRNITLKISFIICINNVLLDENQNNYDISQKEFDLAHAKKFISCLKCEVNLYMPPQIKIVYNLDKTHSSIRETCR